MSDVNGEPSVDLDLLDDCDAPARPAAWTRWTSS